MRISEHGGRALVASAMAGLCLLTALACSDSSSGQDRANARVLRKELDRVEVAGEIAIDGGSSSGENYKDIHGSSHATDSRAWKRFASEDDDEMVGTYATELQAEGWQIVGLSCVDPTSIYSSRVTATKEFERFVGTAEVVAVHSHNYVQVVMSAPNAENGSAAMREPTRSEPIDWSCAQRFGLAGGTGPGCVSQCDPATTSTTD